MIPDWFSPSTAHILFILFILVVVGYVLYSGACTKVTVRTGSPPIKSITFAYKFKVGAYKQCGALYREAHSLGPKLPCIGVFYSDPQRVLGKLCCYAVGSILSEDESQINMELLRKYEAAGFSIFCFPEAMQAVTTSFPYRTYLSIYLRLIKVYPPMLQSIKIKVEIAFSQKADYVVQQVVMVTTSTTAPKGSNMLIVMMGYKSISSERKVTSYLLFLSR